MKFQTEDSVSKKRKCSIASAKNKGREGQKEVVKILLKAFPRLVPDDLRSCSMGSQGEDILMSPTARKLIPWNIEVKRGKAFNLVNACKQADFRNKSYPCNNPDCKYGKDQENFDRTCHLCNGMMEIFPKPVAIGRYDRDKTWYATVKLEYLLELIGGN